MATTTTLQLTLTSKSKAYYASGTAKEFDITPATATCEVPVVRSEVDGIKERIRQTNENIANPPTSYSEDDPGYKLAGYGLSKQSMYVPNPEDYEETYVLARVDRISAAKMTIVETENIYDYRNA